MTRCGYTLPSTGRKCKNQAKPGCKFCSVHMIPLDNPIYDENDQPQAKREPMPIDGMMLPLPPQPAPEDTLEEEVDTLIQEIHVLRIENRRLKDHSSTLDNAMNTLAGQVARLEEQVQTTKGGRRRRIKTTYTERNLESRAKMMYYQSKKNDVEIIGFVKERIQAITGAKNVKPPFQLIRMVTNNAFDNNITEVERTQWMNAARDYFRSRNMVPVAVNQEDE